MNCRVGCGACCIALSISTPIPGMPEGKPAGVRCVQLTADNRCLLYGRPDRPAVCVRLRPEEEMCGRSAEEALANLYALDRLTRPDGKRSNAQSPGEAGVQKGCSRPKGSRADQAATWTALSSRGP